MSRWFALKMKFFPSFGRIDKELVKLEHTTKEFENTKERIKMKILFKNCKNFTTTELAELFLSVGWSSGQYPEKLQVAMQNSDTVLSAWDKDELIGLMTAMSDGVMNVYFQYLLVKPEYQKMGIGRKLVDSMLQCYDGYLRKALISYNREIEFYKNCGFKLRDDQSPMFVTSLTT